eukprot:CAMPEP_0114658354 /NCGR_PEP_ID=MMETSP0191-20121206/15611_1 /TAXON_ID=126664 /ORGANISM="Sorites sp." /LENGTH=215 /DNA_ID=CAMNT_0001880187 /DNA_START=3047 /DNA_END=3694 /DNA_ORIENTATION=-
MGCCQAKKDDNSYQKIDDKPALVKAVSKVANTVKDGAVYGAVFTAGKVKDGAIVGVNAVGKGVSRAKSGVSILKDHIIDNEDGPLMLCPRCDGAANGCRVCRDKGKIARGSEECRHCNRSGCDRCDYVGYKLPTPEATPEPEMINGMYAGMPTDDEKTNDNNGASISLQTTMTNAPEPSNNETNNNENNIENNSENSKTQNKIFDDLQQSEIVYI